MNETDKSSLVVRRIAAILDARKRAAEKLQEYLVSTDARPGIESELFHMLNSIDDLLELASPSKTALEFHGVPEELTSLGERKRVIFAHIERPEWDFTAWFAEKATSLKRAIKELIMYYEIDYASLSLQRGAISPRQFVRTGIEINLQYVQAYAQTLFDEVFDDRLEIKVISE